MACQEQRFDQASSPQVPAQLLASAAYWGRSCMKQLVSTSCEKHAAPVIGSAG